MLSTQLEHDIQHAEQRLPLIAKEEAAYKAQRRKQLEQRAKEFPPEMFAGCYSAEDLKLLGLRRSQLG